MSTPTTVLACTDLDQTLIYSRRAAGEVTGLGSDRDPGSDRDLEFERDPALHCVEHLDGTAASFLTARAAADLRDLDRTAHWVPATTRTVAQYRRVRLPRAGEHDPEYALCANGGILLHHGAPDADWAEHVRGVVDASAPTDEVDAELRRLGAALPGGAMGPVRDAEGLFRYATVDRSLLPATCVEDLAGWCRDRGWRTSVQGRKVYVVPAGLTKATAAREVARRLGAQCVLAAGDSLLDEDLLEFADAGIRPAHGELASVGWRRDHVAVTVTTGVHAGEEIARWLRAQSRAEDPPSRADTRRSSVASSTALRRDGGPTAVGTAPSVPVARDHLRPAVQFRPQL